MSEGQPDKVVVIVDPTWLDRLPSWSRYLLTMVVIGPLVAGVLVLAAVAGANGISGGADYGKALADAVDLAVKGAAVGLTGWVTMFVLPITRKFGFGSGVK